jgi:hypothetical protein
MHAGGILCLIHPPLSPLLALCRLSVMNGGPPGIEPATGSNKGGGLKNRVGRGRAEDGVGACEAASGQEQQRNAPQ